MNRFFLILTFIGPTLLSQVNAQIQNPTTNSEQADSTSQEDFELFNQENKNTFKVLFSGKPGRAALYSLMLPGAGQFYNKRYWKIPLVYGGLAGVGYLLWYNNDQYKIARQNYKDSFNTSQESIYYNYYLQTKKKKEQAIFAVIGVYLLNVFDAYIDRHLIDFDMSDDLSIEFRPYADGISPVGLTLAYDLHSR